MLRPGFARPTHLRMTYVKPNFGVFWGSPDFGPQRLQDLHLTYTIRYM